ncbi:cache domain-containing protein [Paenibacillus sp. P25]|nr:cache domain-containing protein [Paenibacillus sp. P25]
MNLLKMLSLQRSIFIKFTLAFVLVGLIPLSALSYLLLDAFTKQMEQYASGNLEQMMLYMSRNTTQTFQVYNDVSKLMYSNGAYYNSLSASLSKRTKDWTLADQQTLWDFLSTVLATDRYIRNVIFVRQTDHAIFSYSRQNQTFYQEQFPLQSWSGKVALNEKGLTFIDTHPDTYFSLSKRPVMTFGRNLIDISTTLSASPKVLGTLYFDVDVAVFDDMLANVNLGKKNEVIILGPDHSVIYSNITAHIGTIPSQEMLHQAEDDYLFVKEIGEPGQQLCRPVFQVGFVLGFNESEAVPGACRHCLHAFAHRDVARILAALLPSDPRYHERDDKGRIR